MVIRKVVFLIASFIIFSTTIEAQVQRSFWGLELGRSTKTEVKSFILSNKLQHEDNFNGYDAIGITDLRELTFGGYSWSVTFIFYNNILYHISMARVALGFSTTTGETYEIDTKFIFHDLRGKLNNKYGTLDNPIGQSQNHYVRRDQQTVVELELNSDKTLSLDYYDRRLARASMSGNDL